MRSSLTACSRGRVTVGFPSSPLPIRLLVDSVCCGEPGASAPRGPPEDSRRRLLRGLTPPARQLFYRSPFSKPSLSHLRPLGREFQKASPAESTEQSTKKAQ